MKEKPIYLRLPFNIVTLKDLLVNSFSDFVRIFSCKLRADYAIIVSHDRILAFQEADIV